MIAASTGRIGATSNSFLSVSEQKMGKYAQLSKEKRRSVITFRNGGQSLRQISRTSSNDLKKMAEQGQAGQR